MIQRPMMPYPIIWTPCSSRKSPPVVSWQKRPCPPHCCPAQTAPPLRPPTLTAITASCLRWDQSGVSTNYCARVLFSHLLFALLWSQLVLFFSPINFPKLSKNVNVKLLMPTLLLKSFWKVLRFEHWVLSVSSARILAHVLFSSHWV